MVSAKLYNQKGEETGEVKLNPKIFNIEVKENLVHQVVVSLMGNRRQVIADTQGKGEVRGGGRKPWKQKGTGRARVGSSRSPLWKGGGVIFGPKSDRNFETKINKKMRKKALFMTLSDKANAEAIKVLESFEPKQAKTKLAVELLKKLGLKKVLVVVGNDSAILVRSVRNIPKVTAISADSLNVLDTIKADSILFTKDSLGIVEKVFLKEAK